MENIENLQESREATVIGIVCFVMTVATLAVAARIYTRAVILKSMGVDDYMAMFSLVSLNPVACPPGLLRHWKVQYMILANRSAVLGGHILLWLLRCLE